VQRGEERVGVRRRHQLLREAVRQEHRHLRGGYDYRTIIGQFSVQSTVYHCYYWQGLNHAPL
jgi:hypothetical protein